MYCIRFSTLRKYTLAAAKGLPEVTLPYMLASPDSSYLFSCTDCAIPCFVAARKPHTIIRSTAINRGLVCLMTGSFLSDDPSGRMSFKRTGLEIKSAKYRVDCAFSPERSYQ